MRVLVAVEPADFRCGMDGLAQLCRQRLEDDPLGGTMFVFRNRRRTSVKVLVYDGQGMWLCQKRMSQSRFEWWPTGNGGNAISLKAHELQVLLSGGDPYKTGAVPLWREVNTQNR
jgi:transposase